MNNLNILIYLWDVVVSSFSFFFLQFNRNTSDWGDLDTFHQVSNETLFIDGKKNREIVIKTRSNFKGVY
jgi:hypothetical protein